MNERIKELAEQAGFQYIKDEGIGWAGNHNSSLSKFAELIVRDCIKAVSDVPFAYVDYRQQIEESMQIDCVKAIQKRFGV